MLQPDGKILASGSFERFVACPEMPCAPGQPCPVCDTSSEYSAFGLLRFNADGSVDTSFGDGGEVATRFALPFAYAESFLLLPDGSLVVVGTATNTISGAVESQGALARSSPAGVLGPNFGDHGEILTGIGAGGSPSAHIRR